MHDCTFDAAGHLVFEQSSVRDVQPAIAAVHAQPGLSDAFRPRIGVILGSGFGRCAERLLSTGGISVSYENLPGMPLPHVSGHTGQLVLGQLHGLDVAMLQGRSHFYEGHSPDAVVFGVRLLSQLGIRQLLLTNAAGGIREGFRPGDLMLISDHIKPLAAADLRFDQISVNVRPVCDDSETTANSGHSLWCKSLREAGQRVRTHLRVHEGIYGMMTGPTYETPAEIRMLKLLGADAVGMSTVPEALCAVSLGIEVLGVSCITNLAAGLSEQTLSHNEVTLVAASIEAPLAEWMWAVIDELALMQSKCVSSFVHEHGPRSEPT